MSFLMNKIYPPYIIIMSLIKIVAITQSGNSLKTYKRIPHASTVILSDIGSRNWPRRDTWFNVRARNPSRKSVSAMAISVVMARYVKALLPE